MTTFLRIDVAASVLVILAILFHLGIYVGLYGTPAETGAQLYWRTGLTVGVIIAALIVAACFVTLLNRDAPEKDEREQLLVLRAVRNMAPVYAGALLILFSRVFEPASPMATAHMILFFLGASELVRLVSLLWYGRTGS